MGGYPYLAFTGWLPEPAWTAPRSEVMNATKITSITVAAAIALGGAAPSIAGAKATKPGKHKVNVESIYVYDQPGKIFDGTVFEDDTVRVKRLSPSGKWAYGFVNRIGRHAWIKASALDKVR